MADGGDFRDSFSLMSDHVFDQNCNICEEDDIVSEAICYCTVCDKHYCKPCRDFHNKFQRDHRGNLLDGAAMLESQPKRPASVALTTMCKDHGDKIVEIYCGDHQVVCCILCQAINHNTCKNMEYVPKIATGFSKDPDVAKTKSDLHKVMKDLVTTKSSRQNDQTRIKKEKQHILVQVEDSRRRIKAVFDKLEEAVKRGADTRYKSFDESIQKDLDACEKAISTVEKTIADLEDTDKHHEAQLFVHVKNGEQNMEEWRTIVDKIQDNIGKEKIKFKIDEDIQDYLEKLETLGEFVDEMTEPSQCRTLIREKGARGLMHHVDSLLVTSQTRRVTIEDDVRGKPVTNEDTLKGAIQTRRVTIEDDVRGKPVTNEDTLKGAIQTRRVTIVDDVTRGKPVTNVDTLKGVSQTRRVNIEEDVRGKPVTNVNSLKETSQTRRVNIEEDVRGKPVTNVALLKEPSQIRRVNSETDVRGKPVTNMALLKEPSERGKPVTNVDTLKGVRQPRGGSNEKDVIRKAVSKPSTVVKKDDTMVKMKSDSSTTCTILGSCCLPDDGALLSDSNNNKLKRLNSSYKIIDSCNIQYPRGVCYIQRSNEAAVAAMGAIHIISLGKQMKVVKTIKMGNVSCYGLAYCNGLLYVSGWGRKLYVTEYATGRPSQTVETDTNGEKIFSRTQNVATNADGTRIWVTDYDMGLIQLDKNLNLVRVVKTGEMGGTSGVCVDNKDTVYFCGEEPRNVLQLTANGEVKTLLLHEDLAGAPTSVSYDNKRSQLLVTMFNTDKSHVFHIK